MRVMGRTSWIRAFAAASLFGTGCTKYTFEERVPESIKEVNRVVPAAKPTPADILFVVDNSGSMDDEQENLRRNFGAFIDEIAGAGDYQLAIVTTDLDSIDANRQPFERRGRVTASYGGQPYYALQNGVLNTAGCQFIEGLEHGCFRGDDPSTRIIKSNVLDKQQQSDAFKANVLVGSCGSGLERGLDAMIRALERSRDGDCNAGFLRPEANLVIVLVSDEEDSDQPGFNARPIGEYVNQLQQFKDAARIRVAAIVGSRDGEASRCGLQPTCGSVCTLTPPTSSNAACTNASQCATGETCTRDGQCKTWDELNFAPFCWWCSYYSAPDCCLANRGGRYVEFAKQMEQVIVNAIPSIPASGCRAPEDTRAACLIDSICQQEFDKTLSRIARDLVLTNTFNLSPPAAYPPGVVVVINGEKLRYCDGTSEDCDYRVTDNGATLEITGSKTPKEGDEVEIYYTVTE